MNSLYRTVLGSYEHIAVAERALGHRLPAGAEVHHVDGDRRHNAGANLVICQDQAHHRLLHMRARIVRAGGNPNTDRICADCKLVRPRTEFSPAGNQCRLCNRIRCRAYRARHRDRLQTYDRQRRRKLLPRHPRHGEFNSHAKLTAVAVRDVLASDASARVIASRHGVSKSLVIAIRAGKLWAHVSCAAELARLNALEVD